VELDDGVVAVQVSALALVVQQAVPRTEWHLAHDGNYHETRQ
jgi:hypothetical protein